MRDADVARLLRDDGDGEAGARSPPKTPENVTSERMDEDAPAWEDARAAKAKGDAHVKVRAEPRLERYRARARLRATRTGPRPPRTAPPRPPRPSLATVRLPPFVFCFLTRNKRSADDRRALRLDVSTPSRPPTRRRVAADANASYSRALLLMAATRETHTTRTHETTRRSYTNDEASAFLEASTLSNRAMTARRLFRFADALDDATRARSRCETYDAFSERPSVRFELLSIKIACAQADALVNLPGRAWEACGVLRETLRRLARAGAERTTANDRTTEAEATINRRSVA